MLPRHQRLRANREFQRVYRSGRSWAHPLLAMHVLPQPEGKRVGVSVSKKVGKAVERNRVRRRAREAVRSLLPIWREGFDLILVARAPAAEASYHELRAALEELSSRARLVREPGAPEDSLYTMPAGGRSRNGAAGRRQDAGKSPGEKRQ